MGSVEQDAERPVSLCRFGVVERGAKLMYLNTAIRGYPLGLRVGADPRKPTLNVSAGFESLSLQGVPYSISSIEVWGCGDQASRETQLEIKKWQVREAERQSKVRFHPRLAPRMRDDMATKLIRSVRARR